MNAEMLRSTESPPEQSWVSVCPFDPYESRLEKSPLGPGELYKFDILCTNHFDKERLVQEINPDIQYELVLGAPGEVLYLKMIGDKSPQE